MGKADDCNVPDSLSHHLQTLRREHEESGIDPDNMLDDPLQQFAVWMQDAIDAGIHLPNTMTVATVDEDGRPSARVTLLKGVDDDGFVFFSNYDSRKARQMRANPYAALVFYWGNFGRQVRVEGVVERTTEAESANYFLTRSRGSQVGAWASPQSRVISGREELDGMVREIEDRFDGQDVPLPPHWGGFRLRPDAIEFWKGRPSRLHDRVRYRLGDDGAWIKERLAP